ncbi:site-specific integrase [Mesorhizobium sp. M0965]|uniref:site-specific integrase n=1 Tax=unclassified Mesorhizobium TaxID=325217 RepID=UPI00333C7C5D
MAKLPERMMARSGTFYCRIWVPTDIAPIYGRKIVVRSLRTKDLKTAKSRLARKSVELENRFDEIRADQIADDNLGFAAPPDSRTIRAGFCEIAREHAIAASDHEFSRRAELFSQATAAPARFWHGEFGPLPVPADFGHDEEDAYTYFDHLVAEGDLEKVIAFINRFRLQMRIETLQSMRATGNLGEFVAIAENRIAGISRSDAIALGRLMLEHELDALRAIAEGQPDPSLGDLRAGNFRQVENPEAPSRSLPTVPTAKPISLDELFERWEAETDPSASTLSSWRGIIRDLKSFVGDKADDINCIAAEDIVGWKDKLVKADKAAATISRGYLGCARALFRFAVANKLAASDPCEGVKLTRKMKAGKKMLGYSGEEVARLLNLASNASDPWKRWLPWLAAATGSRIGEVAQLHGSHVFEENGYQVVKIVPASDAGSIKNAESERTVPIHPALLAAGFLEFVAERGQGPLFYRRSSGDPKRKQASKGVANRLASWIRKNGFSDPRKAPNHALRHWFKTEASRVGISDSVADAIQGHTDSSSSGVYRHIGLAPMASALEKIELPPRRGVSLDA